MTLRVTQEEAGAGRNILMVFEERATPCARWLTLHAGVTSATGGPKLLRRGCIARRV